LAGREFAILSAKRGNGHLMLMYLLRN